MRNLLFDFNLTVLWPLISFALVITSYYLTRYVRTRSDLKRVKARVEQQISTGEVGQDYLDWRNEARQSHQEASWFLKVFASVFLGLAGVYLLPGFIQIELAWGFWILFELVSLAVVVVTFFMILNFTKKQKWLNVAFCVGLALLATASAEHSFHQTINAKRIACPHCTAENDSDYDRPDIY